MAIDRFLLSLQDGLARSGGHSEEVLEELRGHLEDAAADLQLRGVAPEESVRIALERAGPPEAVVAACAGAARSRHGRAPRPLALAAALALAGALLALGGGIAAANTPHAPATPAGRNGHVQAIGAGVARHAGDHAAPLPRHPRGH